MLKSKLILSVVVFALFAQISAAFKYATVGLPADKIEGKDIISGQNISLDDLRRENLVIVVFWATWSPRSINQLEDMKILKNTYSMAPLEVIAVNVDAPELSPGTRVKIDEIVKTLDAPFYVIIDSNLEKFYQYGVIAVPSTAVVDTSGVIRYDPAGYSPRVHDLIEDSIKSFLGMEVSSADVIAEPENPPDPRAIRYLNLAYNLKKTGMYERALSNLEQALTADSNFAAPFIMAGEIYIDLERIDDAGDSYHRAISLDSNNVKSWAGLGRTHILSGEYGEAIEILKRALIIDESYAPALLDMGRAHAHLDSLENAVEFINRAIELNPGDVTNYYYLGRILRQLGDTNRAVEAYLNALQHAYPD